MTMYCNLENKEDCEENFKEFKTKFFTGRMCLDCTSCDLVDGETCCNSPDIKFVNQPNIKGAPIKKAYDIPAAIPK